GPGRGVRDAEPPEDEFHRRRGQRPWVRVDPAGGRRVPRDSGFGDVLRHAGPGLGGRGRLVYAERIDGARPWRVLPDWPVHLGAAHLEARAGRGPGGLRWPNIT